MSILHDLALIKHAAHAGELDVGLRACERILSRPNGLPPVVEAEARAARTFYIPAAADVFPGLRSWKLPDGLLGDRPAGWTTFNPCCLARGGELLVLVRSSNYRIVEGRYVIPPEDTPADGSAPWIKTRTLLLRGCIRTDGGVFFGEGEAVQLYGPDYESNGGHITGLEDLRLREGAEGELVVSGTCLDYAGLPTGPDGSLVARIATARLLPDAGLLVDFDCPPEPFPGRYEKNWSPIEGMPDVWLYSAWEDGRVATVRRVAGVNLPRASGSWVVQTGPASPFALRHLRGRSQLIRFGDAYLGIFGEATDDGRRMYDHRLVSFDLDLVPTSWSSPFRLGPLRGVEFVAGLALVGTQFVVSYGLQDEEARIATIPIESVISSLRRIPC
jgi:hypothetical protein